MNQKTYIEEDEIDLKELFLTIWNNKKKIIIITSVITLLAVLFSISKPNIYTSSIKLAELQTSKGSVSAELDAYINLNFQSKVSPKTEYIQLIKSYSFVKEFILKYKIYEKIGKNHIYPLGLSFSSEEQSFGEIKDNKLNPNQEAILYSIFKSINSSLSIKEDKKTALITFSYESANRFLNKFILDNFLIEASAVLYKKEMDSLNTKINSFRKEIITIRELQIKNKISELISILIQKKVFLVSDKLYKMRQIQSSEVAHIQNKTKPKRSLIVTVAFVTGFIFSIFLVFVLDFFKKEEEELDS